MSRRVTVDSPAVTFLSALLGIDPELLVAEHHRSVRNARLRAALVLLTHLALAVVVIGGVYGFILLMWAAFGTDPVPVTDIQLPAL